MKQLIIAIVLAWGLPLVAPTLSGNIAVAAEKVLWIDVRTKGEWDSGHLKNAILIPYDAIASNISKFAKHKKQPIKLYCRSGRRAEIALRTLEQLGYTNVQNLGSYQRLKKQGY